MQRLGLTRGDHGHRTAPYREYSRRADFHSGADRRNAAATQHPDVRRLHQVPAERHNGQQRTRARTRSSCAGLSAGSQASQGSGSTGLWPNVAIYLDNQSAQLPNRNLDIYAADLNRIEVLEGPQGTLFGAGAEAGVIRYITNEPKLDVTEGNVKAGYSVTAHGDPNTDVTAVLNVPLIEGTLAVRGVIYDDHRGGYIDNVPATFTRKNTDLGIAQEGYGGYPTGCVGGGTPACQVPPGQPRPSTTQSRRQRHQPRRLSRNPRRGLYKINDDWNVLLSQSYQEHEFAGRVLPAAECLGRRAAAAARSHAVQSGLQQGQVREHRLDRERQDLGYQGRLYRRLPRSARRAARRLYELRARLLCRLLSVPRPVAPASPPRATRRAPPGTRTSRTSTCSTSCASARRTTGVRAASSAPSTRTTSCTIRPPGMYKSLPPCTSDTGRGQYQLLVERRHVPGHLRPESRRSGRQHLVLSGPVSPDQTDGVLCVRRLRHHSQGADATAGTRHFLFQNSMQGSVLSSFDCFEAGVPPGGCHNPAYSYNLNADESSRHRDRASRAAAT